MLLWEPFPLTSTTGSPLSTVPWLRAQLPCPVGGTATEQARTALHSIEVVEIPREAATRTTVARMILATSKWGAGLALASFDKPSQGKGLHTVFMNRAELVLAATTLTPDMDSNAASQWLPSGGEGVDKVWTCIPSKCALIDIPRTRLNTAHTVTPPPHPST